MLALSGCSTSGATSAVQCGQKMAHHELGGPLLMTVAGVDAIANRPKADDSNNPSASSDAAPKASLL